MNNGIRRLALATVAALIGVAAATSTGGAASASTTWTPPGNITYAPATGDKGPLQGPDRGFRYEIAVNASDLSSPWDAALAHTPSAHIDDAIAKWGAGSHVTQLYFYLWEYAKTDVTAAAKANIQAVFDELRSRGMQAVLRFAFDDGVRADRQYTVQDVQRTIQQLAPVVQANADVVSVWQSGFVGDWGEWGPNYYNYQQFPGAVDAIMSSLIDALPAGVGTQMRYPWLREHVNAADRGVVGYNNDYFVVGGNGNEYYQPSNSYYSGVLDNAPTVSVDGEMPWDKNQSTDPYAWSTVVPGDQAAARMQSMHYSTFSQSHNATVSLPSWKNTTLTASRLTELKLPFTPSEFSTAQGGTRSMSQYDYIRDHLGYRLRAVTGSITAPSAGVIAVSTTIANDGFSAPRKPYGVTYVLRNSAGQIVSTKQVSADVRTWQGAVAAERASGAAVSPTYQIGTTFDVSALPADSYQVGLIIGKTTSPGLSVQLANNGVAFTSGVNVLGTVTASANSPITGMSQKRLDLASGVVQGSRAVVKSPSSAPTQQWRVLADQTIRTATGGGLCLEANGHAGTNGTAVQIWACNGGANQKWQSVGGQLKNVGSGRCLDIPNLTADDGVGLVIWTCNGGANQLWTLP